MMCLEMERLREKQAERDELQALMDQFLGAGGVVKSGDVVEREGKLWDGGINRANKDLRPLSWYCTQNGILPHELEQLSRHESFPQCWLHQGERKYLATEVQVWLADYKKQKRKLR